MRLSSSRSRGLAAGLPRLVRAAWSRPDKRGLLRSLSNTYWTNYLNLSLVARGPQSPRRLQRTALEAVLHYLYNGAHYAAPELWPGFAVREAPGAALPPPGQGVLFACQHVGPQRFAFLEMAARGYRVNAAMSEEFVARAAAWLEGLRSAARGEAALALGRVRVLPPVEHPEGPQEMLRALRRGEALMFDVDGNTGVGGRQVTLKDGLPLRFLGREIHVRDGIARLAFRTGVPIVPLLACWNGWRRPELRVYPALRPAAGESEGAFAERALVAMYGLLEDVLRDHPAQWEMWSQLARWQRPSAKAPLQPIGVHAEALGALLRSAPATRLQVDPRRAHPARVRGKDVLVDPAAFRFFVVPRGCARLLARLNGGAPLRALVRGDDEALGHLARLAALGILELPSAPVPLPVPEGALMPASAPVTTETTPPTATPPGTLADALRARAAERPDARAFLFLGDDESETSLTFAALDRRARAVAVALAERGIRKGERALLLLPPGLDFVAAFFGCLYAGVLAVPCPLPDEARVDRLGERIRGIAEDCAARAVLTVAPALASCRQALGHLPGEPLELVAVDELGEDGAARWTEPGVAPDDVAFLQYTSGSTAAPKGVMVTHRNLVHNVECLRTVLRCDASSVQLSWLPQFHDAGLIHGVLLPVYAGIPCIRLSPLAVVKHPGRWLRAVERFGVTHTGGPNFAFELCVRRIGEEARGRLDLRSLRFLFNAAEPIRVDTLRAFAEAFAVAGFRPQAVFCAYGLAESTLIVTGAEADGGWRERDVDAGSLEQGVASDPQPGERARTLVSSGRPVPGTLRVVVDPREGTVLPPGRVGEIWTAGPSVAKGYWRKPEETAAVFGARVHGSDLPFLRTGDLGFVDEQGETFVTGRSKDLVIVRGRNVYPQDVERAVEACHPALRVGGVAAFAMDAGGEEGLVVVQEASAGRAGDGRPAFEAMLSVLAVQHDLVPAALVLVAPRSVPKTSSGKVRRSACRDAYRSGRLEVLAHWGRDLRRPEERPAQEPPVRVPDAPEPSGSASRADAMIDWLRGYAGERLDSRLMDERRCIPPFVVLDLGLRGLMGMVASERDGGSGLGARDLARVLEQLAAVDVTLASFVSGHNVLGLRPILRHGGPALRARHVPDLAAGRQLAAFAATEEGAGANVRAIATTATPDGRGGFRLRGTKIWSGSSSWAGVVTVVARVAGGPGGFAAFAVPQDARGLRFGPEDLTMGLRGMVQNSVILDDVPVDASQRLGAPDGGLDVAQDTFAFGRFAVAAVALGVMKRCAQLAVRYASRRTVATGVLLQNPAALARLSDVAQGAAALECLVDATARLFDRSDAAPGDAALACKILGAELAWRAADDLVQVLGGRGYVETNVAPQILRDVRILRIFEGPTEALQSFLGARALQDGAALQVLLERDLGAPGVSRALSEALERSAAAAGPGPDARLRSQHRAGALAAEALLWAAAEDGARRRPQTAPAARWARRRFEDAVAEALASASRRDQELSADALVALVEGYGDAIGDVRQRRAGERVALDPLLEPDAHGADALPAPQAAVVDVPSPDVRETPAATGHEDLRDFLVDWIARQNGLDPRAVDPLAPLSALGLDSVTAVMLVDELERRMGRPLRADLAWSHPSIDALARHLAAGATEEVLPAAAS